MPWTYSRGQSSHPIIVKASGAVLFTEDGQAIIDAASGAVVANIGHGRLELAEVARNAILTATYVHPEDLTPFRIDLCETLRCKWLPASLSSAMFFCSGTEGIEAAIKTAVHYQHLNGHPRKSIIGQDVSYHGATHAALAASGRKALPHELDDFLGDTPHLNNRDRNIEPALFVNHLQRIDAEKTAAIVVEPIVGSSGGVLPFRTENLLVLREFCTQHGILLIFDEVMTGFGRTGERFAFEHYGIIPDILVSGKGLGAGYAPITGVFTKHDIADTLERNGRFIMTPTYGAHNPHCAIALKVLEILESENLVDAAKHKGAILRDKLARFRDFPTVREVRGLGLFWGIELNLPSLSISEAFRELTLVCEACRRKGVYVYPAGRSSQSPALLIAPPFIITVEQIQIIVDVLSEVFTDLTDRFNGQG
jgi:adenosylmethionine-8-amino-7-oxononanoate aminotransferase